MEGRHNEVEDQVSINGSEHEDIAESISEIDKEDVGQNSRLFKFKDFIQNGMERIDEGIAEYDVIKKRFVSGMGLLAKDTNVVAIHRKLTANVTMQARIDSFRIFSEAMAQKCGGDPNIKIAWYGSSRNEITQIFSHGFSRCEEPKNDVVSYGVGIHLVANFSLDSAIYSIVDESGLRHIILCRVILGKMEQLNPGSKQILPSSKEFDSGVDNLEAPTRYVIWGAFMNTHILPEYLISFASPGVEELRARPRKLPSSPWMSFPILISNLSRILPAVRMSLVVKSHDEYKANKITRRQLIQRVRQLAGDQVLISMLRENSNEPLIVAAPSVAPPPAPRFSLIEIPSEAPNDVAPRDVPKDAPNDVAPSDAPNDVAASNVPSATLGTIAPNDVPGVALNDAPSAAPSDIVPS